ncbi:MAG: AbiV family abortive infection protein [Bacteroidia bacterium]
MKKERNLLKLMSDAECGEAYRQSLISAGKHRETATSIAKSEQYGISVSHLILGTEEMVKALLLQIQSIGIDVRNVPSVYLFFTDHIIKHNFAIYLNAMYSIIKPFMGIVYKKREEIHNPGTKQEYTQVEKAILSKDEKRLKVIFKDIPGMFDWWDEANKMKNRGFYVDYTTSLETPMQVTKEEYHEALKVTDEFGIQIGDIFSYFEKLTEDQRKETAANAKQLGFTKIIVQIIEARKEQRKNEQKPPNFKFT